jgi:hypothetical protein
MADWVWSSNSNDLTKLFVYRKGQEQERVMKNGVKKYNPAGIGIDGGWGTYFKPKKGQQYTLIVSIEKPDSIDSVYSARLLVKGGGWK